MKKPQSKNQKEKRGKSKQAKTTKKPPKGLPQSQDD